MLELRTLDERESGIRIVIVREMMKIGCGNEGLEVKEKETND